MWKVVNFRSFLLTLLCSIFTIISFSIFPQGIKVLSIAIVLSLLLVLGVVNALERKMVKATAFFVALVFVLGSIIVMTLTEKNRKNELDETVAYKFNGKIEKILDNSEGATYLVGNVTADDKDIGGKIYLTVENDDDFTLDFLQAGDNISFNSDCEYKETTSPTADAFYYRNDVRYFCHVVESEVKFVSSSPNFFQKARNKIRNALYQNLGEYAPVAYSMIVGDKANIDDSVRNYYTASGLGHILAVSGLHIGFVTLVLSFVLRKLKVGKKIDLLVHLLVLLFYCTLASFSPSVVRASIMCLIGKTAYVFGKQRDGLNSLCFALSIVLLIWPYSLFDAGFQMSASATLGLLLFQKSIDRTGAKILPSFISRPISLSLGAQIGITPVLLYHFNSFPIYSILTNVLVAPLISVAFIAITLSLILVLLFPAFGIIASFCAVPLALLDDVAHFVSLLPFANESVYTVWIAYFAYAIYFVISPFFMLPKFKWLIVSVCSVALVTFVFLTNISFSKKYDVFTMTSYKDVSVVVRNDYGTILIGDMANYSTLNNVLTLAKIKDIDAVYLTSCDERTVDTLVKVKERFGSFACYTPLFDDNTLSDLVKSGVNFYRIDKDHTSDFGITAVYDGDLLVGYTHEEKDVKMLMLGHETKVEYVPVEVINECQIVRCYVYSGEYRERIYVVNYENSYAETFPTYQFILEKKPIAFDLTSGKVCELVIN